MAACIRIPATGGRRTQDVQTFGTTTADLLALRDWLQAHGVTHVAMGSTGVYWKPVFYVLEDAFTCLLVNAALVKQVPGRKTDVQDCVWIAQLLEHGLLRGSFVPPVPIRELRDLTRYRKALIGERQREANRLHKVLEEAGIKLASVASDILGQSTRGGGEGFRECTFSPGVSLNPCLGSRVGSLARAVPSGDEKVPCLLHGLARLTGCAAREFCFRYKDASDIPAVPNDNLVLIGRQGLATFAVLRRWR